jgi:hypothetical protein
LQTRLPVTSVIAAHLPAQPVAMTALVVDLVALLLLTVMVMPTAGQYSFTFTSDATY